MPRKRAAEDPEPGLLSAESKKLRLLHLRHDSPRNASIDHEDSQVDTTPTTARSIGCSSALSKAETSVTSRSTHVRAKKFVCTYDNCGKAFDRPVRLQAHLNSHTGDRPHACDEPDCGKTFLKRDHLKAHIQNKHSNSANHVCTYVLSTSEEGEVFQCRKAFTTASRLRRHIAAHEAKEENMCKEPGCGQVFRKMETLQLHVRKEHWQEEEPFRCTHLIPISLDGAEVQTNECGQTFTTIGKLNVHRNRHHCSVKFFCEICSPSQTLSSESVDMASVSGQALPEQTQEAGFTSWAELQAHKKTVHPPACDICGKVCDSNRAVRAHKEIEHVALAERQKFRCPYPGCDRGFTKEGNLKVHYNSVHANIRNFVCGEYDLSKNDKTPDWDGHGCGTSFKTKNALEGHVRTQHLNLPLLGHKSRAAEVKKSKARGRVSASNASPSDPGLAPEHSTALSMLTGVGYKSSRPLACWAPACPARFIRDFDLAQHMELGHGWNVDDINDRLFEKRLLEGEDFWVSGGAIEDEEDGSAMMLGNRLQHTLNLGNSHPHVSAWIPMEDTMHECLISEAVHDYRTRPIELDPALATG